jgi:cytochrome c-type biogenesis protein CcmE
MNAAVGQAPAPMSRATALKIVASVVAVVGAVTGVLVASAKPGMEHYKHVDEVMADGNHFRGKRLQVHGFVVKDSILRRTDTLEYKFKLESKAPRGLAVITAEYRGLVPDNFQSGAEVVAKGTIGADDRLQVVPDGISAKCPSKYEAGAPKLGQGSQGSGVLGPAAPVANTAQR